MTIYTPTHKQSLLNPEWLYLHAEVPPAKWPLLPSFGNAASWLGMHHSLRKGQGELDYLGRRLQEGKLDWEAYRPRLLKAAELHYGHLDGHHRNEDESTFPRMRRDYPRLIEGFDLLENDHQHIDQQLHLIGKLLTELKHADKPDPALAERLAKEIALGGEQLYRHLADEEDLVIPILALEAERGY
ncbi:MAG: hemerythrin domain-containing protein [Neisseria sp.]|nr:hemerythrin domain-containing protein [Neisseria sp.]